MRYLP